MPQITALNLLGALSDDDLFCGVDAPGTTALASRFTAATVRAYIASPLFDLDTNTPFGSPLNGVYRIRHGFDNFLSNSSFEAWLSGTSVAPSGWVLNGDATVARSATASVGTYSAQIVFGTANTGELYQVLTVDPNVDYTFSCYVQRTAGTGAARLVAQRHDSPFTEYASVALNTGAGWQLATLTVKPSAAGTGMRFSIKSGGVVASTWLVDETMCEESKGVASTWTPRYIDDTYTQDVYGPVSFRAGINNLPAPVAVGDAVTKAYADSIPRNRQTGTAYTLALTDVGGSVEMNNAAANTVTFPQNSAVAIPVEAVGTIGQYGAGLTTLVQGTGATVRSRGGLLNSAGQYAVMSWHKIGTNEFWVTGDLA